MGSSVTGCPKCGGMLVVDRYLGEWYEDCIQCGYVRFLGKHTHDVQPKPLGEDRRWVAWLGELSEESTPRQRQSGRSRTR
jgi:hypothetical protein